MLLVKYMIKILMIDDEIFARDAMAKIISKKGFDVVVASTGEEGLKLFKEEKPDVVFLDVMLPDLDGDNLYDYIKEIKNDITVYFITGSELIFPPENAKKQGAKGYLKKPVELKDLFDILDEIKGLFGDKI